MLGRISSKEADLLPEEIKQQLPKPEVRNELLMVFYMMLVMLLVMLLLMLFNYYLQCYFTLLDNYFNLPPLANCASIKTSVL